MKILHVGKYYPPFAGGIENFHADLAREQAKQGLRVTSLVHHHEPGYPSIHEEDQGTHVYRVRIRGKWMYTPITSGFRQAMKRVIHETQPDLIHFHLPNPSAKLALTIPTARRIPWVVQWQSDIVGSDFDRRLKWAYGCYGLIERRFLAQSAAIIAASPPYLESSQPLQPWRSKCHVVPLGIAPERLPAASPDAMAWAEQQWDKQKLRLLCIGRLTYYKGHEYLIRALAQVASAQLLIIGTGDLAERLRNLIREAKVADRVHLLGYLQDDPLRGLLTTCDCLTLPSVERTEAFGLVMVEAMGYARPVLATRIPGSGVGWVVQDRQTGWLVPPRDPLALADAIRLLHQDPDLRRRLGEAAHTAFKERFHITPVAASISEIYQTIRKRPE